MLATNKKLNQTYRAGDVIRVKSGEYKGRLGEILYPVTTGYMCKMSDGAYKWVSTRSMEIYA